MPPSAQNVIQLHLAAGADRQTVGRRVAESAIGIIEGLRRNEISFEQAREDLFNLDTYEVAREGGFSQQMVELLEWGMELEDVHLVSPEALEESYSAIESLAQSLLSGRIVSKRISARRYRAYSDIVRRAETRSQEQPWVATELLQQHFRNSRVITSNGTRPTGFLSASRTPSERLITVDAMIADSNRRILLLCEFKQSAMSAKTLLTCACAVVASTVFEAEDELFNVSPSTHYVLMVKGPATKYSVAQRRLASMLDSHEMDFKSRFHLLTYEDTPDAKRNLDQLLRHLFPPSLQSDSG